MPVKHLACCNDVDASVSLSIAQLGNVPLPSCHIGLQILCPKVTHALATIELRWTNTVEAAVD